MRPPPDIQPPRVLFRLAGAPAEDAFHGALAAWRVRRRLSRPATLEVTLHDPSPEALREAELGAELELVDSVGTALFRGNIVGLERERRSDGLRTRVLRAADGLDRLRQRQAMKRREGGLLREIVASVCQDFPVDMREDGPRLTATLQWGQNDLDWLAGLCAAFGWYFFLDSGVLKVIRLYGSGEAVRLDLGGALFEARIEASTIGLRTSASACGWSPATLAAASGAAMDFTFEAAPGFAGARAAVTETDRDLVGGELSDDAAAGLVAQADLERSVARASRMRGLAEGDWALKPGVLARIEDAEGELSGEFTLTEVEHAMEPETGHVTAISSDPPADPRLPPAPAPSLGVVEDTDDPARWGRVRVSLAAFDGALTDWLSVVSAGAGANKGTIVQPEPGDKVIVAFASGNAAQGVVLGGVYTAEPHDADVAARRPRPYTLRTTDGQQLRLDDGAGSASLRSRAGRLELAPDGATLSAEADLRIEAPGRRIVISAARVDFEQS